MEVLTPRRELTIAHEIESVQLREGGGEDGGGVVTPPTAYGGGLAVGRCEARMPAMLPRELVITARMAGAVGIDGIDAIEAVDAAVATRGGRPSSTRA